MTWGEGISTLKFFDLKTVEKLKKKGSVANDGKSQSRHEMARIELYTGGPLFYAESRLFRARRSHSANRPQNQLTKHRLIPDFGFVLLSFYLRLVYLLYPCQRPPG